MIARETDISGSVSSRAFYTGILRAMNRTKVPFMVGGTCAINAYLGLKRETKDVDVFCRAGDYPRLLAACARAGYRTEVEDERWIAKVRKGRFYCDVIFGSANAVAPVTEGWFRTSHPARVMEVPVKLLPPTELIWAKAFIQDRYKFDGNDVVHLILRKHEAIDWRLLLGYFEQHWEVLLMHVLRFRYVYPSERNLIPVWMMEELLNRLRDQRTLPTSDLKICRGRLFSRDDFEIDIGKWGFADVVGDDKFPHPNRP